MEKKTFAELMDRGSRDRLEGEIHLFCRELEEHGYHSIDIAKALVLTALARTRRENHTVSENFYGEMLGSFEEIVGAYDAVRGKRRS